MTRPAWWQWEVRHQPHSSRSTFLFLSLVYCDVLHVRRKNFGRILKECTIGCCQQLILADAKLWKGREKPSKCRSVTNLDGMTKSPSPPIGHTFHPRIFMTNFVLNSYLGGINVSKRRRGVADHMAWLVGICY